MNEIENYLIAIVILNVLQLLVVVLAIVLAIRYAIKHDYATSQGDDYMPEITFTSKHERLINDDDNSDKYYQSASGKKYLVNDKNGR